MASTYNDIRTSIASGKVNRIVFTVAIFALLLVPFVGMIWAPTDESIENRELVSWPEIYDEEAGLNVGILSQMGDYFSDHFAYRVPMIDAGAHLYAGLFGVSTADTVIVGDEGWLYYAGTLNDYQNRAPLREGEMRNIAHNLKMFQDYCEERGARFVFAIAPNKNTLYGADMPFYYPSVSSNDMEQLQGQLESFGVNYVDLFSTLGADDERLYFYRDSHWTEKGALIVHDALAEAGGFDTLGLTTGDLVERDDYTGDLSRMLYPLSPEVESNWYAEGVNDGSGATGTERSGSRWMFIEGASVEDSSIITAPTADNGEGDSVAQGNGSLLMFRDSFGNSLVPYLACEFSEGTFSKRIPYNGLLVEEDEPSVVIVERAQRHVDLFATDAPLMVCPTVDLAEDVVVEDGEGSVTCEMGTNGPLVLLKGVVEGVTLSGTDEVLVRLTDEEGGTATYRAFALSDAESGSDQGYCVYASKDLWSGWNVTAEVMVQSGDELRCMGTFEVQFDA